MTLESKYNEAKASYLKMGYAETSWQWMDEGRVYAIQDYLSSCGDMTADDWKFARDNDIDDIVQEVIDDECIALCA